MDEGVVIIKLDSDIEELDESHRNISMVDLTSDTSANEIIETSLPAADTAIVCVNDDIEDGEVEEAQEAIEKREPSTIKQASAFEIKFSSDKIFKEYGHPIIDALDKALNLSVDGSLLKPAFKFSISNEICNTENWASVSIKAFFGQRNDNTVLELSDCEEAVVDTIDKPESVNEVSHEDSPDLDLASLFTIDTSGSEKLDTQRVPSYKRKIKDVLNEESLECKRRKLKKEENDCPRVRSTVACFNCGVGGHSLRECPKPRNNARINRAKVARKHERYHIDIEQRFGHLRPGKISDKLQAALGLKRGEIPFFYYRMRKFGYPPGWLEETKVMHSGISLFNSDGDAVAVLGSEEENSQESDEQKFDISKVVDFPGFNVDLGPNFYDDYKHHNVPPFSRYHLKEEFIKMLGNNVIKGYKHKKLKSLPAETNVVEKKTSILESADMEIEDDVAVNKNVVFTRPPPPSEPACDDKPPPPPSPPPEESPSTSLIVAENSTNERSTSPTLDDLEERKQKLLAELKAGLCDSPKNVKNDESITTLETSINELNVVQAPKLSINNETVCHSEPTTPITNGPTMEFDVIKESHIGTPVLQFSPYDKLPAGENFKVGVSDVINFENLPDSTGKYEQMKEVIKKVRDIVTKLHNTDDD